MKTYFTSIELPHQWAHQLAPRGKCPAHENFEGVSYYSYGTEIARIIERKGKGKAYLLNVTSYSPTTSNHQRGVRSAIPNDATVFEVGDIGRGCSLSLGKRLGPMLFDYAIEQAAKAEAAASRARQNKAWYQERQAAWLEKAKTVNEFFGLRRKVDDKAITRLQVELWLMGESDRFPCAVSKVYLRVRHLYSDNPPSVTPRAAMETSKGVTVPLADAERAFRFVIAHRTKGWRRNGEQCAIGQFQLDSVSENGVVAGCHHVTWEEIERFAKLQGWA